MAPAAPAQRLASLFRRSPVLTLPDLERALPGRSRRSLFRDLSTLDYLTSYTHAGGYYALRDQVPFDECGLFFHQGVGFSVHGTLKDTSRHRVADADAGCTHGELARELRVRVHNTLLDLVREEAIDRANVGPTYLYVSAEASRAAVQVEARRRLLEATEPTAVRLASSLVIEVLLEVLRAAREVSYTVSGLTRQLLSRGVAVTPAQVEEVLKEHGIVKKGRHSRSRSSRR